MTLARYVKKFSEEEVAGQEVTSVKKVGYTKHRQVNLYQVSFELLMRNVFEFFRCLPINSKRL